MKKNLLLITPDQMRFDYLGCYGNSLIKTKHIDALSKQGVTFDNCYCASPLCAPSRISFATSTYFSEHNHRNYWSEISPDVPNIVNELKKNGYRTGMFGKNHLFTYSRLNEVWDDLEEICLGNYDGHPDYKHSFSSFTLDPDHPYNMTGRLTDKTIDFMTKNAENQFIAWVNYQDPHPAFTCPPPYNTLFDYRDIPLPESYRKYQKENQPIRNEVWRKHAEMDDCSENDLKKAIAHYMGQIRYVDDCIGKITNFLKQSGLEKNTVVLFFADHGELLGSYNMTHKLPAFYDCLTKIPVILKTPDNSFAGKRYEGLVEEVDLVPTLLDYLNIPAPPTMIGKSLLRDIETGDCTGKKSILCEAGGGAPTCKNPIKNLKLTAPHMPTSFGPAAMIRCGSFKLTMYYDDLCELYDLSTDPHEICNLYENPLYETTRNELTAELCKRLLGVKIRNNFALEWQYEAYPHDVRFEPLEKSDNILT